ncbi:putative membrane protein [Emiliania huxleyi virus 164]|nr:putative membrane protein [Emiliania huxleyi virus 164]
MAAALETNSLKNDCEQSLGVTPDDNTENRCKSIAVDHIYGKIPTATVTTRQILESCNSDGQLMSRTCMEAARLSSREDVEALLGPAFTKYCTQIHPEDSRCVEGTAFTFVNTEQATSADFKAAYYHEYLWPIVMVVVCATVYCIQKTTTKTGKDRNFYFQVLACLGIGSLLSHMLLPTYTADAISGFKRNAFIS